MCVIKAENITKVFGDLEVLKNVSLEVDRGEVISIIGPSGSGKSTFLRCLQQLEEIDGGKIKIDDKKLGMIFQNLNLFPHKTVIENISEAPIIVNKMNREKAVKRGEELLKKVGLLDKKDDYPCDISGGQKQRVAIARALAMEPEILLFDEPTSALDPELVGEVLSVIKELAKDHMTMIIVTHEMAFAREVSDYIVFMDEGKIIEKAIPNKMFTNPDHPRIKVFLDKML
ncbi:amino acid ABC transporter ATP-binding protein [Lutibacter sp. B2]|nr:amino acid ABC transporter ATP-binding protein [Lutibacter sp. B2]